VLIDQKPAIRRKPGSGQGCFDLPSDVDERSAEWFGWTPAAAKRHRLNLVKTGWRLIDKGKLSGNKIYVYYLGKKSRGRNKRNEIPPPPYLRGWTSAEAEPGAQGHPRQDKPMKEYQSIALYEQDWKILAMVSPEYRHVITQELKMLERKYLDLSAPAATGSAPLPEPTISYGETNGIYRRRERPRHPHL
jgi:hypothetical protein